MSQESSAATRAKNKYRDKTYDRLEVVLPKGRKAEIQALADAVGQSVNGYVSQAVDERERREKGTGVATGRPMEDSNANT